MKVIILPAGKTESCHPLTVSKTVGELPAGNRALDELRNSTLAEAGFELVASFAESTPEVKLFMPADSYIGAGELGKIKGRNSATVIEDREGKTLAWCGFEPNLPDDAEHFTARTGIRISFPWDLLRLNELIVGSLDYDKIDGEMSDAAHVEGHLIVGEGTRLLPGVFVEGNVIIGKNCKIGPNCYLRGNTSIGHNCHIGQAVEIKNSLLMHGVSVGHLSYCGDTIIANNANLGAGTITANLRHDNADHLSQVEGELVNTGRRKFGAIIGEGAHTGIHTSLYPGRKMWPGTTTRPGEVVKKDVLIA